MSLFRDKGNKSSKPRCFADRLDIVMEINKPAREGKGEDSFYCVRQPGAGIVCVCDGCGGLGATKYFNERTGAYLASRLVSGALHDWCHNNEGKSWKDSSELAASIDGYIRRAFARCSEYIEDNQRVFGTMIRKLPSTLTLAYAEEDGSDILVHLLWAGDSRAYILDSGGLAQLSVDDTAVQDAMENLYKDAAMTNVLSADGNFVINNRTIRLTAPAVIFTATDGCFGYIPSPMEFEYEILDAMMRSDTPEKFKAALNELFSDCAGDDYALGLMSFDYGSYEETRKAFRARHELLDSACIDRLRECEEGREPEVRTTLWQEYKQGYERYLGRTGI